MSYLVYNGKRVVSAADGGKYVGKIAINPDPTPITVSDWALPSYDALSAMRENLFNYSVGNFSSSVYWAAGEWSGSPSLYALSIIFSDGGLNAMQKTSNARIRACRDFTAETGSYSLRDVGPSQDLGTNGLIFYITDEGGGISRYYQAYGTDNSASHVWSNITSAVGLPNDGITYSIYNTLAIIAQVGHTTSAAKVCNDLN